MRHPLLHRGFDGTKPIAQRGLGSSQLGVHHPVDNRQRVAVLGHLFSGQTVVSHLRWIEQNRWWLCLCGRSWLYLWYPGRAILGLNPASTLHIGLHSGRWILHWRCNWPLLGRVATVCPCTGLCCMQPVVLHGTYVGWSQIGDTYWRRC